MVYEIKKVRSLIFLTKSIIGCHNLISFFHLFCSNLVSPSMLFVLGINRCKSVDAGKSTFPWLVNHCSYCRLVVRLVSEILTLNTEPHWTRVPLIKLKAERFWSCETFELYSVYCLRWSHQCIDDCRLRKTFSSWAAPTLLCPTRQTSRCRWSHCAALSCRCEWNSSVWLHAGNESFHKEPFSQYSLPQCRSFKGDKRSHQLRTMRRWRRLVLLHLAHTPVLDRGPNIKTS